MTENQEKYSPMVLKLTPLFGTLKPKASQKSKDCSEQNMDAINEPHKVEKSRRSTKPTRNIGRHPEDGKTTNSSYRARSAAC